MALFKWNRSDSHNNRKDRSETIDTEATDSHIERHEDDSSHTPSYAHIRYGRTRDDIGPYDDEHPNPDLPTLSFGSLEFPMIDGMEYIPSFDNEGELHTLSVIIGNQCAEFTLFSARTTPGLWMSSYEELIASAQERGFTTFPQTGVWGKELLLRPQSESEETSYRFAGIEGIGYLLRICYFGAAAEEDDARELIDDIVENIVVHRDNEIRLPGTIITLELPDILRQAMEDDEGN